MQVVDGPYPYLTITYELTSHTHTPLHGMAHREKLAYPFRAKSNKCYVQLNAF